MSAKQAGLAVARPDVDDDRLAGARSAPSPCRDRPRACAPGATMNSSAVAPCSAKPRSIAALTRSTVSGSPSTASVPLPVARAQQRDAGVASPLPPRVWARRIPASSASLFTRRRSSKTRLVRRDREPVRAQTLGHGEREAVRHDGSVNRQRRARAREDLAPNLVDGEPQADQLVVAELLERVGLDPAESRDPLDLERRCDDVPHAADLDEEEHVGYAERHLVTKLRRPERVADDEEGGHGAILPPVGSPVGVVSLERMELRSQTSSSGCRRSPISRALRACSAGTSG